MATIYALSPQAHRALMLLAYIYAITPEGMLYLIHMADELHPAAAKRLLVYACTIETFTFYSIHVSLIQIR